MTQERRALKATMKDRVRLWRRGECPELRDEPIGPRPEPHIDTDRGGIGDPERRPLTGGFTGAAS